VQAEKEGASYIGLGPIYFTPVKADRKPVTVGLLSRVKKKVKVPVVAIGGINHTNIDKVLNAGADGVAVIRAAAAARDITKSVKKLKKIISKK
jgi:thiamine-phosphate pyrophosphorylase